MAGETSLTVVGRLTADPEVRHTQGGLAVANFTVASNARRFDRENNDWKDGDTLFLRCAVWREHAENVAASLHKGDHVIVCGDLEQRNYETKEGEKRTAYELRVDQIGAALQYATVTIQRRTRAAAAGDGFIPEEPAA
jgi:single-strand DNA-binding protein